jgi:hypothetical protein
MAILTVEELRDHVQSSLEDDALQRFLDASEEAIIARAGPTGARTEFFDGVGRFITLARPASALTSISEEWLGTVTTMQADDYRVWPDGYSLERIPGGTNSRHRWHGLVTVQYTATSDDSLRELVQIELVESLINYNPGLTQQTIGTWSEAYANNSNWNNADEWEAILSKLDLGVGMVVIG